MDNEKKTEIEAPKPEPQAQPKKRRKTIRRIVLVAFFVPILLLLSLIASLYIPAVQRWAVKQATHYLASSTGYRIDMASFHLRFPLSLDIAQLSVQTPEGDTMAYASRLQTSLPWIPLLNRQIDVPQLKAEDLRLFFPDSAKTSYFRMSANHAQIAHIHVNLKKEKLEAAHLTLDGSQIQFWSIDTIPSDTPPLLWRFEVERANLSEVDVLVNMPFSKVYTHDRIRKGTTEDVVVQLGERFHLELGESDMALYEGGFGIDDRKSHTDYVDYTHMVGYDARIQIDKFLLDGSNLAIDFDNVKLRERSGASVSSFSGSFALQDETITLENVDLSTPLSTLAGKLSFPLAVLDKNESVKMYADMQGSLHPKDLYYFTQIKVQELLPDPTFASSELWRDRWNVVLDLDGTLREVDIRKIELQYPEVLHLKAEGRLGHILTAPKRNGDLELQAEWGTKAHLLLALLGREMTEKYRIPAQTRLVSEVHIIPSSYDGEGRLQTAQGYIDFSGGFSPRTQDYKLRARIREVDTRQLLPQEKLGRVSLDIDLKGKGLDFLTAKSESNLALDLQSVEYDTLSWKNAFLSAHLRGEDLRASLHVGQEGLMLDGEVTGAITKSSFDGNASFRVDTLDCAQLGWTEAPLQTSFVWDAHISSDYAELHEVESTISQLWIRSDKEEFALDPIRVKASSSSYDVDLLLSSGDFKTHVVTSNGLNDFIQRITQLIEVSKEYITNQPENMSLSTPFAHLPSMQMDLEVGTNNSLYQFLKKNKLYFSEASLQLHTHPDSGIAADLSVQDLRQDTLRIDQVSLKVRTDYASQSILQQGFDIQRTSLFQLSKDDQSLLRDTLQSERISEMVTQKIEAGMKKETEIPYLKIDLDVNKRHYPKQPPFRIALNAKTDLKAVDADVSWTEKEKTLYAVGLVGYYNKRGLGLIVKDQPVIVSGEKLSVNPDNSLFYFTEDSQVFANLQLKGFEGAELSIVSSEEDRASGIERVGLVIKKLELEHLQRITKIPGLKGLTFADIQIERENKTIRATGDLSINGFYYNNRKVGDIGIAAFYEPKDKNTHYITSQISFNGNRVMTADGLYHANSKNTPIELTADLLHFPLELLNPFIGTQTVELSGSLTSSLDIHGTFEDLKISGVPRLEKAKVHSFQLGNTFQLDNRPVLLEDSRLVFDQYKVRMEGKESPLILDGSLFIWGKRQLDTDLKIVAKEVLLLDSKPQPGQWFYGKLLTDADLEIKGSMVAPIVRGTISILGETNCTYVYSSTGVKPSDNMAGVVQFTDFSDTLAVQTPKIISRLGSMDIALNVHIDPVVRMGVDLSPGHQDYVEVIGGGDLRFNYSPFGQMSLIGKYDAVDGDVRYNFPVVGRRSFKITPNSSLVWSGAVDNPQLNFEATQLVRADVVEAGASRKVDFLVSIVAKDDLEHLNLAFDLESPEDIGVQSRIASMTPEERGKQAMALMISRQFLASDPSKVSVEKILSNLAIGELNNLIGKVLDGTDLNVGIEFNDPTESGSIYTNYTYSFSRRFYNDRIRFVIGGKVSTGVLPTNYEQTFIDNLTLEYRIDNAGRNFATLFHKRNSDNILEGLVTETGVGYVIKSKLDRLGDLFLLFVPKRKEEKTKQSAEKERRK